MNLIVKTHSNCHIPGYYYLYLKLQEDFCIGLISQAALNFVSVPPPEKQCMQRVGRAV